MSHLVFVYGTLTRTCLQQHIASQPASALLSHINQQLQNNAQWLGAATTRGALYQVAHYPALVPALNAATVHGELYQIADAYFDALIGVLDEYEECQWQHPLPHEYRRERILVEHQGQRLSAWGYLYNHSLAGLTQIESGRFK